MVTQNFDRLAESAADCVSVGEKALVEPARLDRVAVYAPKYALSVLPYKTLKHAPRWLMKMHGCVSKPEDILITSADYANYESGRLKALAGIVHSSLMTSHFLFVGYSMTDPNYRRIVEEVKRALDVPTTSQSRADLRVELSEQIPVHTLAGVRPSESCDEGTGSWLLCGVTMTAGVIACLFFLAAKSLQQQK